MSRIKRFVWLIGVWFIRILGAPNNMKTPFFKRLYYNFRGYTADQVSLYDLNLKNVNEYLSEFDWYKSRKINGKYEFILNNKLICNDLIKNYVRVPEIFLIKEKGNIVDYNSNKYTIAEVFDLIKSKKSVYFKPISIGKGIGVSRIDYKTNKFFIDYKECEIEYLEKLLDFNDNYFISEAIVQDKYLNNIYDKTSNTIRLITVRDNENKINILYAVQRIGTSTTIPVDNGSQGGLVAKIDLTTGKLSAARSIKNKEIYKKHPDSHNNIEGVQIPNWDVIKNKAINLMEKLPYLKFVAWDLLITEKDICVIEANSSSGVNIIQVFGGQKNKELGKFFKENNVIK